MEPTGPSSSKVTVEYFDPWNLFPLLSSHLLARLPLRNLHWKSPTRPLRSIDSLHIDLVPHEGFGGSSSTATKQPNNDDPNSRPSSRGSQGRNSHSTSTNGSGPLPSSRGRRHQIPGLRRTPYLKIYLLRCDDNETYKASCRKLAREWIKDLAAQQTSQENHDAFEWLIVHVVLPDTAAASQPTTSGSHSSTTSEKSGSTSRWPGRGSSTLLEKLRADFGSSSRSSPDRIAQVRADRNALNSLSETGGQASGSVSTTDGPGVSDHEWSDLISKMKELILTSFDMRVTQYEEDIRDRDAQRTLPGWNFCTFFILKEGLAQGFESAGLVEDALIIYDELEVGLQNVIHEQSLEDASNEHGGSFLEYTPNIHQEVLKVAAAAKSAQISDVSSIPDFLPLDFNKKNYRELILANNISVFDFRCYLLARQLYLLLRIGNPGLTWTAALSRARTQSKREFDSTATFGELVDSTKEYHQDSRENLLALAEMCRRTSDSITSIGRIMKADIMKGIASLENKDDLPDHDLIVIVADHLVSSWIFSAAQQILTETYTKSLAVPTSSIRHNERDGTHATPEQLSSPDTETKRPLRTTSLSVRSASTSEWPSFVSGAPNETEQPPVSNRSGRKAGFEELANNRGQLYLLSREILEDLSKQNGWFVTKGSLESDLLGPSFVDVGLQDDDSHTPPQTTAERSVAHAGDVMNVLSNGPLSQALGSRGEFYELYETLTEKSLQCFVLANKLKSIEKAIGDMAVLKFQLSDFSAAASYFRRLAPFYAEDGWNLIETIMLKMYGQCLRETGKKEEYIGVLLKLLAKSAWAQKQRLSCAIRASKHTSAIDEKEPTWVDDDSASTTGLITELLKYADELPQPMMVQTSRYFGALHVDTQCLHFEDRDGFQVQLKVQYLFDEELEIARTKLRLVGTHSVNGREIWLESQGPVRMKRGPVTIFMSTHESVPGSYIVDKILMEANNIHFVHETFSRVEATTPTAFSGSVSAAAIADSRRSIITYYPPLRALEAKLGICRTLHLEKPRSIELEISSGWNSILGGEIRLKAASAGLRLNVTDSNLISGDLILSDRSQSGMIGFEVLPDDTTVKLRVPYSIEHELSELSVKLEIAYRTDKGEFVYACNSTVPIALPLGVNVQETFRLNSLFSKFTVSTATSVPLRVLDSTLLGSRLFEPTKGDFDTSPVVVFSKQPLTLVYKTRQTKDASDHRGLSKGSGAMELRIRYLCFDEEVINIVEAEFLEALKQSPFRGFTKLILPALKIQLSKFLSINGVESMILLEEIDLGQIQPLISDDVLHAIPRAQRDEYQGWLAEWHQKNATLPLSFSNDLMADIIREIIIPVEIPSVSVVHRIGLQLHRPRMPGGINYDIARIGEVLSASFRIQHSRAWDLSSNITGALEFVYEINANPDVWLIGGARRGHFSAVALTIHKEHETKTISIILVPLRPGHLLLPLIEVRPAARRTSESDMNVASPRSGPQSPQPPDHTNNITCEIDYRNQAQTVLVIPDIGSATINVDPGAPGGGASLVDTQSMNWDENFISLQS